jgi:LCP family protein required for cell wall assembly
VAIRALVVLLVAVVLYGTWTVLDLWGSFRSIERVELDVDAARDRIADTPPGELPPPPPVEVEPPDPTAANPDPDPTPTTSGPPAPPPAQEPPPEEPPVLEPTATTGAPRPDIASDQLHYDPAFSTSPAISDSVFSAFLVIGSDAREDRSGTRADVIILALLPADRSSPILVSLPRDLWLRIPCWNRTNRINAALNGCGDVANGPELLALTVAGFTGIQPDHFALFHFPDFERVIDAFGGIEICVENRIREDALELPAGCTTADGATALLWVRSRNTREFIDGRWRTLRGVNDLTRNERQQDVLIQLLGKLNSFDAITSLSEIGASIADAVTIDDGISLSNLISLAWRLRGTDPDDVRRVTIPVRDHVTGGGAQVLLPTKSFAEVFAEVWPDPPSPEDPESS